MGVFTELEDKDFVPIAKAYGFEGISDVQPITEGSCNSNWFCTIKTKEGKEEKVVFTIMEGDDISSESIPEGMLPYYMGLCDEISKNAVGSDLQVPIPYQPQGLNYADKNLYNLYFNPQTKEISDKPSEGFKGMTFIPFLTGRDASHVLSDFNQAPEGKGGETCALLKQMGSSSAKLHRLIENYDGGDAFTPEQKAYRFRTDKWQALWGSTLESALNKAKSKEEQVNTPVTNEELTQQKLAEQSSSQQKIKPLSVKFLKKLQAQYTTLVKQYEGYLTDTEIKKGVIHGDLFPNNFIADIQKNPPEAKIIDLYGAGKGIQLFDVATLINACALEKNKDGGFEINKDKFKAIVKGYNEERPLTKREIEVLPEMCKISAMRFTLSRVQTLDMSPQSAKLDPRQAYAQFEMWGSKKEQVQELLTEISTELDADNAVRDLHAGQVRGGVNGPEEGPGHTPAPETKDSKTPSR